MTPSPQAPKISVITATRNAEATLPLLYESLVRQTYSNFEWIVVDGLSRDRTVSLLEGYCTAHRWIRFVSQSDFGVYDAINRGLAMASGEYYVVAGADDTFDAGALAKYAQVVEATSAEVVLAEVIRAGKRMGGFRPQFAWISHAKAFRVSHSVGMLFKKDLHERFGYYSGRFPLLADGYFLGLLLRSGQVNFTDADFTAGTFGTNGMSSGNKLQTLAESFQIQMLTARHPRLQLLLFLGKVLVRHRGVLREIEAAQREPPR
jgi:glycosyltransferase involved in cell wall biosynthesis